MAKGSIDLTEKRYIIIFEFDRDRREGQEEG